MNLIFATNNQHKIEEIKGLSRNTIRVSGLLEEGFSGEIPEDFPTIEQNASQKSWYIFNLFGKNCFSDDTGLEVEALNGDPGVYSARFSRIGDIQYPQLDITNGNITKLLYLMKNENNRKANFKTVISLILAGVEYQFEGIIPGQISMEKSGISGFGYDPVFIPNGWDCSFAEMSLEIKNKISHRAIAMNRLLAFLREDDYGSTYFIENIK